jgi:hypothetical protein
MGTGHEFPIQESGCVSRMVEDGFVMHFSGVNGLRTYHTHLNMHGLYLFRQSLLYGPDERIKVPIIRGYEILCRLYEVIESGTKFYKELGYWGPLKFRLRLERLLGIPIWMPYVEFGRVQSTERFSTDDQIDTYHIVQTSKLSDDPHEVILPLIERIGWAFDTGVTPEWLRSMHSHMKTH